MFSFTHMVQADMPTTSYSICAYLRRLEAPTFGLPRPTAFLG
jgi:hypothetical protein